MCQFQPGWAGISKFDNTLNFVTVLGRTIELGDNSGNVIACAFEKEQFANMTIGDLMKAFKGQISVSAPNGLDWRVIASYTTLPKARQSGRGSNSSVVSSSSAAAQ